MSRTLKALMKATALEVKVHACVYSNTWKAINYQGLSSSGPGSCKVVSIGSWDNLCAMCLWFP